MARYVTFPKGTSSPVLTPKQAQAVLADPAPDEESLARIVLDTGMKPELRQQAAAHPVLPVRPVLLVLYDQLEDMDPTYQGLSGTILPAIARNNTLLLELASSDPTTDGVAYTLRTLLCLELALIVLSLDYHYEHKARDIRSKLLAQLVPLRPDDVSFFEMLFEQVDDEGFIGGPSLGADWGKLKKAGLRTAARRLANIFRSATEDASPFDAALSLRYAVNQTFPRYRNFSVSNRESLRPHPDWAHEALLQAADIEVPVNEDT